MRKKVFWGYAETIEDTAWWDYRDVLFTNISRKKWSKKDRRFKITIEFAGKGRGRGIAKGG